MKLISEMQNTQAHTTPPCYFCIVTASGLGDLNDQTALFSLTVISNVPPILSACITVSKIYITEAWANLSQRGFRLVQLMLNVLMEVAVTFSF